MIDENLNIVSDAKLAYDIGSKELPCCPSIWEATLANLLQSVPSIIRDETRAIAIDGTSATSLLVDASSGRILAPPKLYNEAQTEAQGAGGEARAADKEEAKGAASQTAANQQLLPTQVQPR